MVFWSFQSFNIIVDEGLENELRGIIRIEVDETSLLNPLDDLVIQLVDTAQENDVVTSIFLFVNTYVVSEDSYALGKKEMIGACILDFDFPSDHNQQKKSGWTCALTRPFSPNLLCHTLGGL